MSDHRIVVARGDFDGLFQYIFKIGEHAVCVLHCRGFHTVGFDHCVVYDFLSLLGSHRDDILCLCVRLLHDLVFAYQFCRLDFCVVDQSLRLLSGIVQDRFLVGDDLLIALDLLRCLHAQFAQKIVDLRLVYHDHICRKCLVFAVIYVLFDLVNQLLYSAAHIIPPYIFAPLSVSTRFTPFSFC